MSTKYKIIAAVVALLTAYAFGRYSAPTKEKIVTQTVEVEKKSDQKTTDAERNRRRETTTTKETHPDGSTTETTHTVDEAETHKATDQSSTDLTSKTTTKEKEITRDSAKITVSALAGIKLSSPLAATSLVLYGGSVSKPILGPITVGVWYLTAPAIGASIGLTF